MQQYLDLLDDILKTGFERKDRTGTGTIGVFGRQLRFSMKTGFPLLTTKKLHLKSIIYELLWFLQGSTNVKYLNDHGVTIWDEWCDKNGNLGPIYGSQWRNWGGISEPVFKMKDLNGEEFPGQMAIKGIDQIANLINTLKTNPDNRRMIVSAWNVGDLPNMLFPPCHYGFVVSTREIPNYERACIGNEKYGTWLGYGCDEENVKQQFKDKNVPERYISLEWDQRSVDTFLGLPFNIASYGLLLMMIAQVVNMVPEDLICSLKDTHIYKNHIEQVKLQLTREPRPLPKMTLSPGHTDMDHWQFEDFILSDYNPHPHIKADISI